MAPQRGHFIHLNVEKEPLPTAAMHGEDDDLNSTIESNAQKSIVAGETSLGNTGSTIVMPLLKQPEQLESPPPAAASSSTYGAGSPAPPTKNDSLQGQRPVAGPTDRQEAQKVSSPTPKKESVQKPGSLIKTSVKGKEETSEEDGDEGEYEPDYSSDA
jgi:hypothetical protein